MIFFSLAAPERLVWLPRQCKKIRKKLKIEPEKVKYSLKDFGSTSSASIPITMVAGHGSELNNKKLLACAFGVGLSWASVVFEVQDLALPEVIEI